MTRSCTIPEYLERVSRILDQEMERSTYYFAQPSTKVELGLICEKTLLLDHAKWIVKQGLEAFLDSDDQTHLRLLNELYVRVNAMEHIRDGLSAYIRKRGTSVMADEKVTFTVTYDMIQLKIWFESLLESCFGNSESISNSIKESFESFMNIKPVKSAEWIAYYLDALLKGNPLVNATSTTTSTKLTQHPGVELEQTLRLFRYISGKDIFEMVYKKALGCRLLEGKSGSIDSEKYVLLRLKSECGPGFTSKMEGMFKDMDISKEVDTAFKQTSKYIPCNDDDSTSSLDFHISILTSGYWPSYPPPSSSSLLLPKMLLAYQDAFTRYYGEKHPDRQLSWQHSLSHCLVKAHFPRVFYSIHSKVFDYLNNESIGRQGTFGLFISSLGIECVCRSIYRVLNCDSNPHRNSNWY